MLGKFRYNLAQNIQKKIRIYPLLISWKFLNEAFKILILFSIKNEGIFPLL